MPNTSPGHIQFGKPDKEAQTQDNVESNEVPHYHYKLLHRSSFRIWDIPVFLEDTCMSTTRMHTHVVLTLTLNGNHPRICNRVTIRTVQAKDSISTSNSIVTARVEKYLYRDNNYPTIFIQQIK